MSPAQIDRCSMWEFLACVDGFLLANGVEKKAEKMSNEALSELGIAGF